jgi:hypothetical protein
MRGIHWNDANAQHFVHAGFSPNKHTHKTPFHERQHFHHPGQAAAAGLRL